MTLNHSSEYAELTNTQFELIGRIVIEWSMFSQNTWAYYKIIFPIFIMSVIGNLYLAEFYSETLNPWHKVFDGLLYAGESTIVFSYLWSIHGWWPKKKLELLTNKLKQFHQWYKQKTAPRT